MEPENQTEQETVPAHRVKIERKPEGPRLFVKGLPANIDDFKLIDAYKSYGAVKAIIITDMATKIPRGYGFVEFPTQEETERAIAETNGSTTLFEGQVLTVKRAVPKRERIKVNNARPAHRPGQDRRSLSPPRQRDRIRERSRERPRQGLSYEDRVYMRRAGGPSSLEGYEPRWDPEDRRRGDHAYYRREDAYGDYPSREEVHRYDRRSYGRHMEPPPPGYEYEYRPAEGGGHYYGREMSYGDDGSYSRGSRGSPVWGYRGGSEPAYEEVRYVSSRGPWEEGPSRMRGESGYGSSRGGYPEERLERGYAGERMERMLPPEHGSRMERRVRVMDRGPDRMDRRPESYERLDRGMPLERAERMERSPAYGAPHGFVGSSGRARGPPERMELSPRAAYQVRGGGAYYEGAPGEETVYAPAASYRIANDRPPVDMDARGREYDRRRPRDLRESAGREEQ